MTCSRRRRICGFSFLLARAAFISSLTYRSSFLQRSKPSLALRRHGSASAPFSAGQRRRGMVMYFDDVSRNEYTTQWHPDGKILNGLGGDQASVEDRERQHAQEKIDALKRRLHGHDIASSSMLDTEEVREQLTEWASKSGLTGVEFGDEVYESIKSVHVCRSTTVSGCLAEFWQTMVSVVNEENDQHGESDGSQIVMIVFPDCPELYEYKTMSTMHAAVDFCANECLHFGSDFSLTHFHPKYKNAPKMIHPTRHSPFPVLGLHFPGKYDEYVDRLSKKYGRDKVQKALSDNETPPIRDWAQERAATFEVLYNKAAASSSADILSRGTASRNISQRFPKEEVIEMTEAWMKSARFLSPSSTSSSTETNRKNGAANRALRYSDTVQNWDVVYAKKPEEVYALVWKAIGKLQCMGEAQKSAGTVEADKSFGQNDPPKKFSQMEWMNSLSKSFNGGKKSEASSADVISTVFVTTKFRAYNAEGFKRFAITVNAALKRLTGNQMFLEVFHPEYVGKKGYHNNLRRSPYPTLQICYEKGKTKK